MSQPIAIQPMQPADLDFAAACTAAEGWTGETRSTFAGFYDHDPQGCLVAETGDRRVGICVATCYGTSGFIGELIVIPEMRGQGIGRQLLTRAIAYLHARGTARIFLDGVVAAVPLYERLGFQKVCRSMRFHGVVQARTDPCIRAMCPQDLPDVERLDRVSFGADRGFFLQRHQEEHPGLCLVLTHGSEIAGYAMGRRGSGSVSAGPWVARPGIDAPERLLYGLAAAAGGDISLSVGVLESHPQAAARLRACGLEERQDPPWRMRLGGSGNLGAHPACYAIGSPARG